MLRQKRKKSLFVESFVESFYLDEFAESSWREREETLRVHRQSTKKTRNNERKEGINIKRKGLLSRWEKDLHAHICGSKDPEIILVKCLLKRKPERWSARGNANNKISLIFQHVK